MKRIVDSNQLRTPNLREFLASSPQNIAVLPDFIAMEAYKGEPLTTIFKSMSILSDFPQQVLILKSSSTVFGLRGRRKGLQRRLIDEDQTLGFPEYARNLRLADAGHKNLREQILSLGRTASEHLEKMRENAINMREAVEVLANGYSKEERAALRAKGEYSPDLINKIVQTVMEVAARIFRDAPHVNRPSSYEELPNTFIFRVTFACFLQGLRRSALGGVNDMSPDKLRNDFVDMMIVAYGTYFDGLMSAEKNVQYMFSETSLLLSALFDAEVPSLRHLRR